MYSSRIAVHVHGFRSPGRSAYNYEETEETKNPPRPSASWAHPQLTSPKCMYELSYISFVSFLNLLSIAPERTMCFAVLYIIFLLSWVFFCVPVMSQCISLI